MLEFIKNIIELVKQILGEKLETRDDDKKLMMEVWLKQGWRPSPETKEFWLRFCSPPESISRARREVQSSGLYCPINRQGRLMEEKKFKDYYKK